jgi:hypothetical protein
MKLIFNITCRVINMMLFLLALWVGLHDQDYAQAAFLMALAVFNEITFRD